jgi:hypothetical protein
MKKPTEARFAMHPAFNTHPQSQNIQIELNQFSVKDFGNTLVSQHGAVVMPVLHNVGAMAKKLENHPHVKLKFAEPPATRPLGLFMRAASWPRQLRH